MFENIEYSIEYYAWIYKRIILQDAFLKMMKKEISYEEYYDHYNKDYFDLLFLFNYASREPKVRKYLLTKGSREA